jgi:hypothetical protein
LWRSLQHGAPQFVAGIPDQGPESGVLQLPAPTLPQKIHLSELAKENLSIQGKRHLSN